MAAKPRFAHVVFHTAQPAVMRDWYCTVLDAHVVYQNEALSFMTFDDEHHRIALIHAKEPLEPKTPATAAMHHTAYTFAGIDDLLERYERLREKGVRPAVCIAHGVTSSMYYRDPDGNFAELQIDAFTDPDQATAYMEGPEYDADAVGPAFDPEEMLRRRREGATQAELSGRAWCAGAGLGDPLAILLGAP